MKFIITEGQLIYIENRLSEGIEKDNFPQFIRDTLKDIYAPLNLYGRAPNPNNDCETNEGVINIFPHSDQDVWSILNRFDTNRKVGKKIEQIFISQNPEDRTHKSFMNWITENKYDLFGPNGKYVKELVDLNLGTVVSGDKNEKYAIEILKSKFPTSEIKRYCAGDVRDTMKGIDLSITNNNIVLNAQVKPFSQITSFYDDEGDTFFEVKSFQFNHEKYRETNVQLLIFVNTETNQFIIFQNKKQKIAAISTTKTTRFYEPPLYTNMTFKTVKKRKSSDKPSTFFGVDSDKLKNLEFRIDQMMKLRDQYKKKGGK